MYQYNEAVSQRRNTSREKESATKYSIIIILEQWATIFARRAYNKPSLSKKRMNHLKIITPPLAGGRGGRQVVC